MLKDFVKGMHKVKVTIFTPTYNRADLILDLYTSLKKQTCNEFEWLVVDDGSTDNTKEIFDKILLENNPFAISYVYKENGGKHTAINVGLEKAQGEYFCIVDSDDYLKENAVETIITEFGKLPKGNYCGVGFLKLFENGGVVGKTFKGDFLDCTSLERDKFNISGDKTEVFFTDILKNYRFPEFSGEKFLPEAVVWYRIANDGYRIRWVNKGFYICRYQPNGLTMNNNYYKSINAFTLFVRELFSYNAPFITKFRPLATYSYNTHIKGWSFKKISRSIHCKSMIVMFAYFTYKIKIILSRKGHKEKTFNVKYR